MIKEGTRTANGFIWRNGAWRRLPGQRTKVLPPSHMFGQGRDEGILQDVAPQMRGEVQIEVHEEQPDGSKKLVETFSEKNLIVAKAPEIMSNALAGISHPDFTIGGVQWGTGGHVSGDPSTPIPPSSGDLALETFVIETSILSSTIGSTYVQFESQMTTSQGNGNVFTESGLVIVGAAKLMFARKTFPGITKTSNRTITMRWIISFLQSTTGSDCQGVGLFGQLGPIRQFVYTVPVSPPSFTQIVVPLSWTPGLNRLWVWRNGKRVFDGAAFLEQHPTGIININPPLIVGEVWTFEVIE
jgi:hypothetical protein